MKNDKEYIQDIVEIRAMMERSSKFLSLSGWASIMAGIYALSGAYVAYYLLGFNPDKMLYNSPDAASIPSGLLNVMALASIVLILAIGTAIYLSGKKAARRGEKIWNTTSKQLLTSMAIPLVTGGVLILILLSKGFVGLVAPLTLVFYGLALYNASKFTYEDVKFLGLLQIVLGLLSVWFITYSLLFWAIGFGAVHIAYGVYMHITYDR